MEKKFKVGDRVKDDRGRSVYQEGVIIEVDRDGKWPIVVDFGIGGIITYMPDGRQDSYLCPSLHPIDPPAPVLTEWQEKKIKDTFLKYWPIGGDIHDIDVMIEYIKIVMSEPEPPKWVPKENEVCLFRDNRDHWIADRFERIISDGRFEASTDWFDECRPFDIDLIGTTDNP